MSEPKLLIDENARRDARWIRNRHWQTLERIAQQNPNPLYICWWNKDKRLDDAGSDDLLVCSLVDGNDIVLWLRSHPEWIIIGEWSDERYACPVYITPAGIDALENREHYDMEPVFGGLVEPGWSAVPWPND